MLPTPPVPDTVAGELELVLELDPEPVAPALAVDMVVEPEPEPEPVPVLLAAEPVCPGERFCDAPAAAAL